MEQIHEFNTAATDPPTTVASSAKDPLVAVGFKSGFLRILNVEQKKVVHETMIFETPIKDINWSPEGKFMAAFFKNGKIVIFRVDSGDYTPVKNIDYEFPNGNYFSLSFSPSDVLLANISSNANTITVWETRNFSLKTFIDLTGDVIAKI
jgi:WD40 repeat protein